MPRKQTPPPAAAPDLGVLVAGMHRSGTSAIAGALLQGGLYAGTESDLEIEPAIANPTGYAERRQVVAFDNRLLTALGWEWDTPDPDPRAFPSLAPELIAEGRRLIDDLVAPEPWCIKDPRLSLLLPWWRRILLDRFVAVVTVRSPEEVAWSLAMRDEFPIDLGFALGNAYHRHLARGLEGLPVVLVDYAALTTDPAPVIRSLAVSLEALGVRVSFDTEAAIASIRPGLRRATQPDFADKGTSVPASVKKMASVWQVDRVRVLERFHLDSDKAEPWEISILDAHRRMRAVERRASDEQTERERAVRELEQRSAQSDEFRTQVATLTTELAQRDAQGDQARGEAVELRKRLAALTTELEQRSGDVAQRDSEAEMLRTQLATLTGELEQRDAQGAQARGEAEMLRTQLATLTGELEQRDAQGAQARGEAEMLRTQLATLTGELEQRDAQGAQARGEAEMLRTQLATLTGELEQRDAQGAQARGEAEMLRTQLATLTGELEQRSADVEQRNSEAAELSARIAAVARQLKRRNAKLERRTAQRDQARGEDEALRTQLAALETELEQRNAKLEQRNAKLEQRDSEAAELSARIAAVTRQLKRRNAKLEQRDSEAAELSARIAAVARQLKRRNAKVERRTAQRDLARGEALDVRAQLAALTTELEHRSAEGDLARGQVEALHTQLAALTTELEHRSAEGDLARGQVEALHTQLAALTTEGVALTTELEQLSAQREQTRGEAEALRTQLSTLRELLEGRANEVAELQSELGILRTQTAGLEEERGELERSARDLSSELTTVRESFDDQRLQSAAQLAGIEAERDRLAEQFAGIGAERDQLADQLEIERARNLPAPRRSLPTRIRRALNRLPLVHLVWPNPLFDGPWYLATYPDVAAAHMKAYFHWRRHGIAERRDPNALFDTDWYLAEYPELAGRGMDPLDHYLRFGEQEGRDPSPGFATSWYLAKNPDVAQGSLHPLLHYMRYGRNQGRPPRPTQQRPALSPVAPTLQVELREPSVVPAPPPPNPSNGIAPAGDVLPGTAPIGSTATHNGNGNGTYAVSNGAARELTPPPARFRFWRREGPLRDMIRALPSGARVVVGGNPDLGGVVAGRVVAPLSRRPDGRYLGVDPQSSLTAVVQIEAARSQGFGYFLLPEPQAWWLEHFPDLLSHLDRRYNRAGVSDGGVTWILAEASAWRPVDDLLASLAATSGRDPTLLDWHTHAGAGAIFPTYSVFIPPGDDADLPYLDDSVDLVLARDLNPPQLREAQRVARRGVVLVGRQALHPEVPLLSLLLHGRAADLPSLSLVLLPAGERPVAPGRLGWLADIAPCVDTLQLVAAGVHFDGGPGRQRWLPSNVSLTELDGDLPWHLVQKALTVANSELIAFVGADVWPVAGWYQAATLALARSLGMGAIVGPLMRPDGNVADDRSRNGTDSVVSRAQTVERACASFAVTRRSAISALLVDDAADLGRPWDELLSNAIRMAGQTISYEPDFVAVKTWQLDDSLPMQSATTAETGA